MRLSYCTQLILMCLLLLGFTTANAQTPPATVKHQATTKKPTSFEKHTISGSILEFKEKAPVMQAIVSIAELGLWATANDKGRYVLRGVPAGTHTLQITSLGYKTELIPITVERDADQQNFLLHEDNLQLETVVVTAKKGSGLNSNSRIEQAALEHIQPSSITDVMQLVPGNVTTNPNMSSVNHIVIRDTKSAGNSVNALGTSIIVDGASISNNTNLQFEKTSSALTTFYGSSVGSGIDTRQISTDNIESVEVIRGVASAEYGDLTSGAVVVKTKVGHTPWNIRLKTDPATKHAAVGKGFSLGNNLGAVNFDTDYLLSYSDPRTMSSAYNRFNLQVGYSNTLFNKSETPLKMDVKLSGSYSKMTDEADADRFLDNISEAKDQTYRLSTNGTWMLNKPWVTNVSYNLSGSYGKQFNREYAYRLFSGARFSTATQSGENVGYIIPDGSYYSDVSIEGLPYDVQAKLVGNLIRQYGSINNKLMLGFEWVTQGNNGDGKKTADPMKPDAPNGSVLRDRSYKDLPAMNRYSVFLEDKVTLPIATTSLEMQAGMRLTNIQPNGIFSTDFDFSWEPRLNMRYTILQQQAGFKYLRVRGGWGIQCKMPTLLYLYPDPSYWDKTSYEYSDPVNSYQLAVFSTKKIEAEEIANPNLKTPKSTNIEAGFEFEIGSVSGSVIYFNEKLRNGFSLQPNYMPYTYRRYTKGQPSGSFPTYQNGEVMVSGVPVGYALDTVFLSYNKPSNGNAYDKWGVEYTLNVATIKALRTSIDISGAYMHIKRMTTDLVSSHSKLRIKEREYPYVGIYGGSWNVTNGSIDERLNMTVRFITHIPAIRMVVTLTAEGIFMDRSRSLSEYNGQVLAYYYDAQGNRITGPAVYNNNMYQKQVNPIYYMDMAGVIRPFLAGMEQDAKYAELIASNSYPNIFDTDSYPFYGLLNLRLTKEIGNRATVSFYANNFLNMPERVKSRTSQTYTNKNIPLYFGAEVKLNF